MGDKGTPYSLLKRDHADLQRRRVRQGVVRRGRARKGGELNGRSEPRPALRPPSRRISGATTCRGRRPRRWSGAFASSCAISHCVRDHRGDHAFSAAARARGEQHGFTARAGRAARDGAAAPAPARRRQPQKPLEKAPAAPSRPGAAPVDPRVKASKSGLLAQHGRSGGACATGRSRQVREESAEDHRPRRRERGAALAHHLARPGGTSGGISAPTSSGLAAGSGSLNGIRTDAGQGPDAGHGTRRRRAPAAAARPRAAPMRSRWCSPGTRAPSTPCMRAHCATTPRCRARWSSN